MAKNIMNDEQKKEMWAAEWRREERLNCAGSQMESCIMNGILRNEYYFGTLDVESVEKVLNSTSRHNDWRVRRVGNDKIVSERINSKGKPIYRTWVCWKNHKGYMVYSSARSCFLFKD